MSVRLQSPKGVEVDALLRKVQKQRDEVEAQHHAKQKSEFEALALVTLELAAGQVSRGNNDEEIRSNVNDTLRQAQSQLHDMIQDPKLPRKRLDIPLTEDPGYVAPSPHAVTDSDLFADFPSSTSQATNTYAARAKKNAGKTREQLLAEVKELVANKDFEEALFTMDDVIKTGADANTYFDRAKLHIHFTNYDNAEYDLARCIDLDPGFIQAFLERGIIRIKMLEYEGACEDLERVLTAWPDHPQAFSEYRRALRFHGQPRNNVVLPHLPKEKKTEKPPPPKMDEESRMAAHLIDEFAIEREFWGAVNEEKSSRKHE